jgi:hypothetical protein
VRVVFDENTPYVVARAVKLIAEAEATGAPYRLEVLHARDLVPPGTSDVLLILRVADGTHDRAALITTDKAIRTRYHERAAFQDTGCIGIVLLNEWNRASMWDRARHSLLWWKAWLAAIESSPPGCLWRSPWSTKPKPLRAF